MLPDTPVCSRRGNVREKHKIDKCPRNLVDELLPDGGAGAETAKAPGPTLRSTTGQGAAPEEKVGEVTRAGSRPDETPAWSRRNRGVAYPGSRSTVAEPEQGPGNAIGSHG